MKRIGALACIVVFAAGCTSDATKSTGSPTTVFGGATTIVVDGATTIATAPGTTVGATTTSHPEGGFGEPVPAAASPSSWLFGAAPELGAPTTVGVCEPLYDAIADSPYTVQRCGIWNASGGQRMWTVTEGAAGLFLAVIWQENAPNTWTPMMRSIEPSVSAWDDIVIATGNIDSGSNDELVSGARIAGSGGYLSVEIVDIRSDNPRAVAVYNEIPQAIAVLAPSEGVQVFVAQYGGADPECCPGAYQRFTIYAADGDWLVVPGPTFPAGDPAIPVSAF